MSVRTSNLMVEIPDSLRSVFSATVEEQDRTYVVEIPSNEINQEALTADTTYQVAILKSPSPKPSSPQKSQATRSQQDVSHSSGPPVDEGEVRDVVIETVGEQGDGIAKVERGYVVIVPGGQPGDEPTVKIDQVQDNVAFASIVDTDSQGL